MEEPAQLVAQALEELLHHPDRDSAGHSPAGDLVCVPLPERLPVVVKLFCRQILWHLGLALRGPTSKCADQILGRLALLILKPFGMGVCKSALFLWRGFFIDQSLVEMTHLMSDRLKYQRRACAFLEQDVVAAVRHAAHGAALVRIQGSRANPAMRAGVVAFVAPRILDSPNVDGGIKLQ